MIHRRYSKKHCSNSFLAGIALSAVVVVCACVGGSFAFAGSSGASENSFSGDTFSSEVVAISEEESGESALADQSLLTQTTSRDISKGIEKIEEAEEEARIQAELAAEAEEKARAEADAKAAKEAADAEAARIAEEEAAAEKTRAEESQKAEGSWQTGLASAYNIASSSTTTASGVTLDEDSLTVAVPASQSHLLGRSVEIQWNGITVVATVTDTGGFGSYGRALDLAPGVCKAFGVDTSGDASNCGKWGVQTVKYRFL